MAKKSRIAKPKAGKPSQVIPVHRAALLAGGHGETLLRYQREILEQMHLCSSLLALPSKALPIKPEHRGEVDSILADWYLTLAAASREHLRPLDDITQEPDAKKRAQALQVIINNCINDVDDNPSDNVKRFLLHVAWHEGAKLKTRIQGGGGPGRSFYQFEAYRAREGMEYARTLGLNDLLVTSSGSTASALKAASDQLSDSTDESYFPDGNLIKTLLETNDTFGTYLVRIEFKRFSEAIGPTNQNHTDYWYKYWKGTDPDPAGVKAQFLSNCNAVDQLLSSSPSGPLLRVADRAVAASVTIPKPGAPQRAQDVVSACENEYPAHSGLCNGFVAAVANNFDASRGDFDNVDADKITSKLAAGANGWLRLADGIEAFDAANSGKLVIAGALSTDYVPPRPHGHVVVVVSSSATWPGGDGKAYPYGYWGDIDGHPQKRLQLSEAFNHTVRDKNKVVYACKIV
jgi:hypothetical protein